MEALKYLFIFQFKYNHFVLQYFPVSQELIGNVDIKTKTVHFYVTRKSSFETIAIIPFEEEQLNVGEAMNLETGVFTAPVNGLYHFEFAGASSSLVGFLAINLQVNNNSVGRASNSHPLDEYGYISLTSSFRLNANDKVNLYLSGGKLFEINTIPHWTHFTGSLIEEY